MMIMIIFQYSNEYLKTEENEMSLDINFDLMATIEAGLETRMEVEALDSWEGETHYEVFHYMKIPGYEFWRTFGYQQGAPEKKPYGHASYGSNSDFIKYFRKWLEKFGIDYEEF